MYQTSNFPMYGAGMQNDYNINTPIQPNPTPYGLGAALPTPMGTPPAPHTPPLFPNNVQNPQVMPPYPYPNMNLMQARYAKGGSVRPRGISHYAEMVRRQGTGGDTVLAHINPAEAMDLAIRNGATVNPLTGLPEFGSIWKKFRDNFLLPIIGTTIGTMVGGPLGGIIGGGIGGGAGGHIYHQDPLGGMIKGALMAGAYHTLGPLMGAPGTSPAWSIGNLFGGTAGAAGAGAGASGGGAGLGNLFGNSAAGSKILGSAGTKIAGTALIKDPISAALLGTSVLGALGGKDEVPQERPIAESVASAQPNWRPDQYPSERKRDWEWKSGGYFGGSTKGQDDQINAKLSDGEFVIPADVVADVGDGNNDAGAKEFYSLIKNVRKHKNKKHGLPPKAKSLQSYMHMRKHMA